MTRTTAIFVSLGLAIGASGAIAAEPLHIDAMPLSDAEMLALRGGILVTPNLTPQEAMTLQEGFSIEFGGTLIGVNEDVTGSNAAFLGDGQDVICVKCTGTGGDGADAGPIVRGGDGGKALGVGPGANAIGGNGGDSNFSFIPGGDGGTAFNAGGDLARGGAGGDDSFPAIAHVGNGGDALGVGNMMTIGGDSGSAAMGGGFSVLPEGSGVGGNAFGLDGGMLTGGMPGAGLPGGGTSGQTFDLGTPGGFISAQGAGFDPNNFVPR